VASVLGVREEPGASLTGALLRHLRDRSMLLLLDNCEHLVDACARLARSLLQGTVGVKILATSRDPLQIGGEVTYPLQPLAVPAAGEAAPDALLRHESVQLFVDRARAALPAFKLDADNAAAVAEICSRLDGIALAIELAAARVRVLAPPTIASRLDQRFKLLVGGDRTALPRQQTLRALIDWSFDLLPPEEAALFARLAVFATGWTLDAAEQVCGFGELQDHDTLLLLANLVQKSLVVLDSDSGRYRMLETVHAFAQEKLRERGDAGDVNRRHFSFYLALAEQASTHLFGPDQRRWLRQLDQDSENILQAHVWCCAAGHDVEQGLQLTFFMRAYWVERGLTNVGMRMTLEALARPGTETLVMPRIRALWGAADLMQRRGEYAQAWEYLTQCLALVKPLGDPLRLATVLRSLSATAAGLGDFDAARRHGEQAVDTVRDLGQPHALGAALNELAQVARAQLDFTGAGRHYLQALRLVRRERDDIAATAVLLNLALLKVQRGRPHSAAASLRSAVRLLADLRSSPLIFAAFDCAGALHASVGHWERAAAMFASAEARMLVSGQRRDALDQRALQPYLDAVAARGLDTRAFAVVRDAVRDESSALQALLAWLTAPLSNAPAERSPEALGAVEEKAN
jgi:non-specific serine/threonine protein kinase